MDSKDESKSSVETFEPTFVEIKNTSESVADVDYSGLKSTDNLIADRGNWSNPIEFILSCMVCF